MRCAVTGGSGFIGSHVVDKLKDAGHEVRVIDHRVWPHRDDVEFKDVDIVHFSSVLNATREVDVIFHLAAMSNVNVAFDQPVYTVELNALGTAHVLEAARINGIKRVILASTVWVYGVAEPDEVDEYSPFQLRRPGHIYSSMKIASELLCHDYWNLYKQPFTILRYGIPYGPRMRDELVIPIFLKKAFSGQPITIAGDGSQYRNFIYVEDMAEAHVLALDEKAENKIFNLEGGEKVRIRDIAETINKLLGGSVKIEYVPARQGDFKGKQVSREKAKKVLGWEASTTFEQGMEKTIKWFKEKNNLA